MSSLNPSDQLQDDYLPCSSYEGQSVSSDGIFKFSAEDKHYFSFMENGKVILRSEGYASEAGRDNGVASVLKNIENESQYKVLQDQDGRWMISLIALNLQEIARSCACSTEAEARNLLPGARAKARAAALSGAIFTDKDEDNYMICSEYEERVNEISAVSRNFISFTHPANGKHYFAWISDDQKIILRGEGYESMAARDNGIASVMTNKEKKERFRVEEHRGLYYLVLTAGNLREIGRSCPRKSESELWAMLFPPMAAIAANTGNEEFYSEKAAVPVAPVAQTEEGGFKWWWLLLLLLLIPLYMWWKSCNPSEVAVTPATDETAPLAAAKDSDGDGIIDEVDKCPNLAGVADNLGCPELILYYKRDEATLNDYDKGELEKAITFLNNNPNLSVTIEGHTSTLGETDYNQKLSETRANNSVAYLVSKGIDPARLKAVGYGEQFPIGDNETEEGRAMSRRAVVKVIK